MIRTALILGALVGGISFSVFGVNNTKTQEVIKPAPVETVGFCKPCQCNVLWCKAS